MTTFRLEAETHPLPALCIGGLSLLAATVLFAIVTNAAICGIFSNPNARYQSRIAPLAALIALMALLDFWKARFWKARSESRFHNRDSDVEGLR